MAAIPPPARRDPSYPRPPWPPFLALGMLLWIATLLGIGLSAGAVYSQPAQQDSPIETPTFTPDPLALPTDTPDPFAFPTDTPDPFAFPTDTPDPFAFPTDTPDPFALPTDTPDPFAAEPTLPAPVDTAPVEEIPVVAATPAPEPLSVIGRVVAGMATGISWLWFLCGSLIFFVVAGIVGGVLFSQRERHRYDLYAVEQVENPMLEVVEPPTTKSRDDDSWPASLP